jgi:hypothetical protein
MWDAVASKKITLNWRQRRQAEALDFGVRMRNQLALQLGRGEVIVADEPVLVWRGVSLGKKATNSSRPDPGFAILTNQRLRFAAIADQVATDLPVSDIEIVHDEDGAVTLRWEGPTGRYVVTLAFTSSRRPMIKRLRSAVQGDSSPADGPSAPTPSVQQRLLRVVKRD